MLDPLPSIDLDELSEFVCARYGVRGWPEFVPVGADSWNYRIADLWVSLRRDDAGHSPAAYESARLLHRYGLEFVVPPRPSCRGEAVTTFHGYPVVASDFVPCTPLEQDDLLGHRDAVREVMSRLHAVDRDLPLETESFRLPYWGRLASVERTLASLPHRNAPADELVAEGLTRYWPHVDKVAAHLRSLEAALRSLRPEEFVPTHGDLSGTNLVIAENGGLRLLDWCGFRYAPAERDHLRFGYLFPHQAPPRSDVVDYYHLGWHLGEVAEYASALLAGTLPPRDRDQARAKLTASLEEIARGEREPGGIRLRRQRVEGGVCFEEPRR